MLYVAVNWAFWYGLGVEGLAASETPAADLIARAFGPWAGQVTALAIAFAVITSINATIVVGARTTYACALDWPRQPVAATPDGQVPVIYRIDLRNPATFFVMQSFPMQNRDVIYVANAPAAELQKFLNIVFSMAYPMLNAIQMTR